MDISKVASSSVTRFFVNSAEQPSLDFIVDVFRGANGDENIKLRKAFREEFNHTSVANFLTKCQSGRIGISNEIVLTDIQGPACKALFPLVKEAQSKFEALTPEQQNSPDTKIPVTVNARDSRYFCLKKVNGNLCLVFPCREFNFKEITLITLKFGNQAHIVPADRFSANVAAQAADVRHPQMGVFVPNTKVNLSDPAAVQQENRRVVEWLFGRYYQPELTPGENLMVWAAQSHDGSCCYNLQQKVTLRDVDLRFPDNFEPQYKVDFRFYENMALFGTISSPGLFTIASGDMRTKTSGAYLYGSGANTVVRAYCQGAGALAENGATSYAANGGRATAAMKSQAIREDQHPATTLHACQSGAFLGEQLHGAKKPTLVELRSATYNMIPGNAKLPSGNLIY